MRKEVLAEGVELYLGDCREVDIPSGIECIVTSPPYNQMEGIADREPSGTWAKSNGGSGFVRAWKESGYSDSMDELTYQLEQNALFSMLATKCSETASLFYNHQLRWRDGICHHPVQWFQPPMWRLRTEVIWDRTGGMMFNARMFCRFDERIIWFVRGDKWTWNQESVGDGTVWRIPREQNKEHPVAYPEAIPSRCISATTRCGDLVLDPYMGSGTTGAAAVRLGRRFAGVEREPKYFEMALRKISDTISRPDMFVEHPKPAKQEAFL